MWSSLNPVSIFSGEDQSAPLLCWAARLSLEPLAHANPLFDGIAKSSVELDDFAVGASNLQIQLWAAEAKKSGFRFDHHRPTKSAAPIRRPDGEMVDPPAKTIEPCEHGGNHAPLMFAHEKELTLSLELSAYDGRRVVPRRIASKGFAPDRNDSCFIWFAERPDQ